MTRLKNWLLWLIPAAALAGAAGGDQWKWIVTGALVIPLVLLVRGFVGCRHPRPLALLPPVRTSDGVKQPAQWFCGACGLAWPADIEHANPPVPRFVGHDESKASQAARRAARLEVRYRALAVQRAGMSRPQVTQATRRRQAPVPIQPRRAAG
jgi:hypothetical protein